MENGFDYWKIPISWKKNMDLMDVTMKEKWKVAENTMESYHEIMCIGILMIYSQIDTHLYIR